MKYTLNSNNNPVTDSQDCIVISVFSDDSSNNKVVLGNAGVELDKASEGEIKGVLDRAISKQKLQT